MTSEDQLVRDGTPSTAAKEAETFIPQPEQGRGRLARTLVTVAAPAGFFVLFVTGWYLVSYVLLTPRRRFLMPPPHEIIAEGFGKSDNLIQILTGLWQTTRVAFLGLIIAIAIGLVLATLMSQARWIENSVYPYAVVLQTVPIIALVPLIGLWFDYNFQARVIVSVIISLFPIITNTLFGLRSADSSHHDLFTLHGATRMTRLRKLMIPGSVPAMFTGFRISAGLSVIGAIVSDFFFRQGAPGIGRLLDIYRLNIQMEMLYVAIFWSSMLGVVMFWGFGLVGNLLTRKWHDASLARG